MKNVFNKLRSEVKFAKAGEGKRLTDGSGSSSGQGSSSGRSRSPSTSKKNAGQAAAQRFSKEQQIKNRTIKGRVIRKDEPEKEEPEESRSADPSYSDKDEIVKFYSPFEADVLVKPPEFLDHVESHLLRIWSKDEVKNSALMIRTLNDSQDTEVACKILNKYIDNILQNPEEPKFQKIRCSNKAFVGKVMTVKGTAHFLKAIGFEDQEISNEDGSESETYLVMNSEKMNVDKLTQAKLILEETAPIEPLLSRDMQVILPGCSKARWSTKETENFYKLSAAEVKRQQMQRTRELELSQQLRTRAMREASLPSQPKYDYAVIRVRFPDERILQGTFHARETVSDVKRFVHENLNSDAAVFKFVCPLGGSYNDDMRLDQAELTPCAVINLMWDEEVQQQVYQQIGVKFALKHQQHTTS